MATHPDSTRPRIATADGDDRDANSESDRPLLRSFPNPSRYGTHSVSFKQDNIPATTKVKAFLTADVDNAWTDIILIVCFFISGLIDAGAYNAYECFTSMQTGNTIFAALGVSNLPVASPRLAWTKSVCSVFFFLIGSVVTGSFHRTFGERKRWVLCTSFTIQTILILTAAFLVGQGTSSGSPGSGGRMLSLRLPNDPGFPWTDLIPIGLLSFQAAAKVVTSRVLQFNALPVVVLTTLYSDLVSDPTIFSAGLFSHPQRNRRAGGAISYFAGAVLGGVAASHSIGFSGGLVVAATIQIATAGAWLLWRVDPESYETGEYEPWG